jgi:biopolymer transport protein ExbB
MRLIDMPGCGVCAIKTGRSLLEQACASTVLGTGLVLLLSAAALAQEADPVGNALLPRDLSPWGMFKNADVVVQGVLVGLAIASVITWTVWLAKTLELWTAKRRLRADLRWLGRLRTSDTSLDRLVKARSIVGSFIAATVTELQLSGNSLEKEGIKERVASRLERIEAAAARNIARGTGVLATIGATAPFVGLFGTVWGIMNSFIGISKSHTTNLAVVAPGIAEALLATALGLAAAIPAVVIYNVFSRQIAGYRALVGDAYAEVLRLVSRDLDQTGAASVAQRKVTLSAAE